MYIPNVMHVYIYIYIYITIYIYIYIERERWREREIDITLAERQGDRKRTARGSRIGVAALQRHTQSGAEGGAGDDEANSLPKSERRASGPSRRRRSRRCS